MVATVNQILAILTMLGDIFVGLFWLHLIVYWLVPAWRQALIAKQINAFLGRWGIEFGFIVAVLATSGSLFYSEVAGYEPCKLCWFQRIFMYPQTLLFIVALWKKDRNIVNYSLTLSVVGLAIAVYHYLLQRGVATGVACSSLGYSVSCSKQFVLQYGYITIVMMSLTAFAMIISFMVARKFLFKPTSSNLPAGNQSIKI